MAQFANSAALSKQVSTVWNSIQPKLSRKRMILAEGEQHKCCQRLRPVNFARYLAPPLLAAIVAFSPISTCGDSGMAFGETVDIQRAGALFRRTCIGCHDAGGNIIQPGATLFLKDLQRNGVDSEEEIYRLTYYGKGRMPGFGENCTPRGQCTFGARLQEDEIKLLAEFVKSQAEQGWPAIEVYGD